MERKVEEEVPAAVQKLDTEFDSDAEEESDNKKEAESDKKEENKEK